MMGLFFNTRRKNYSQDGQRAGEREVMECQT